VQHYTGRCRAIDRVAASTARRMAVGATRG
jgi:hypothetical protein